MRRAKQTSESIELAVFLTLSGGLMDAYSYLGRGGVFANAQTGNMLLLGVNLAAGDLDRAAHYAMPVLFFAVGIAVAHNVKILSKAEGLHWRQVVVLVEVATLAAVSAMPQEWNLLANSLTSLACGMQVQSFRKLHGHGFATTMCIGNLRSGTQELVSWFHTRDRDRLEAAALYFGVIVCFVLGAVLGSKLLPVLGERTILVSSGLLVVAFAILFEDREERNLGIH